MGPRPYAAMPGSTVILSALLGIMVQSSLRAPPKPGSLFSFVGTMLGGTFSPGDGHCSPMRFGHGLYVQAVKEGAEFLFRAEVTGIETGNARNLRSRGDSEGADIWLRVAALLDQSAPAEPLRRACAG